MARPPRKRAKPRRTARKGRAGTTAPAPRGDAPRAKRPGPAGANAGQIRIRMYRVGFGDCFLLSLPAESGAAHILVDCGVHSQGDAKTIGDAVNDIARESGGRLALVIATHAHQDHVSGFGRFGDAFRKLSVGEVWMPWTENPNDATAAKLKRKQLALIGLLEHHFLAMPKADAQARYAIQNLAPNAEAMALLKNGISGGQVRFYQAGDKLENAAGIAGLSVRVLGPPRDPKFLAKMDPPAGDRFLRLAGSAAETVNAVAPFPNAKKWNASAKDYPSGILSKKDAAALEQMAGDPEGLAFTLDQAVNNTSLVTLFSYKGRNLLFPGDAQYGNWQFWIESPEAKDILASVDFYKVGHHGSHNATPKSALEKMTQGRFAAMISTQNKPWPSIPFGKLMDALKNKAKGVVRSDSIHVAGAPDGPAPKPVPGFTEGPFWFDYVIAV
jgi:beta-lactamase superfamily II metal-dependent hydrolase